jgi:ketosteroid isomerase-like protein
VSEVKTSSEALVRRLFEHHNQGPESFVAELDRFYDPEIEWTPVVVGGLEGKTYRGYDGMRRYYADREEAFGSGRIEVLSCDAVADDVLVVEILSSGVGRGSGVPMEHTLWSVSWLRDGRVYRQQVFTSRAQALEAARSRNEALVRRLVALHNQDPERVLASLEEYFDPEVVWTPVTVGGLEAGTYHGYDGMRRYYADRGDAFGQGQVQLLGCETVGDDVLVAHVVDLGVGRSSGVALEQELWSAVWLRDERVLRWQAFRSRAEAMEAASA